MFYFGTYCRRRKYLFRKIIFESGELVEASVVSILETIAPDGKNDRTRDYNLDAICRILTLIGGLSK